MVLALFTLNSNAQKDSVFINEQKDEMTDKVFYFPSEQLVCRNPENKKQGFAITFFVGKTKKGVLEALEVKIKSVGIGNCDEKDEVIFLLEDETKIKVTMWNDFNCDGKVWCKMSDADKELLATKKVNKIRVQNGRTFESYTHTIDEIDRGYFKQFFFAIKNNKVKPYVKPKE